MRTVPAASSMSTAQSSRRSTSAMIDTSMMHGTLVNTVVPEVSNAAAMSFNTLFFAPTTETSPTSRAPPTTRNRSTTRSYPAGSAPAPDRPRRWVGSGKSYAGGMTAADGTAGSAPGDAPADEATGEPDSGTAGEPDRETAGEPDSGRSRDNGARRHEPDPQDQPAVSGVRRRRRGQLRDRRRAGPRRASRGRHRRADSGPERPVRRRRGPLHPGRRRAGLSPAAGDRGLHHPPRAGLRCVQRTPGQAQQLHPAGRQRRGGAPACRPDDHSPGRTLDVGHAGGGARAHQPAAGALPEPTV